MASRGELEHRVMIMLWGATEQLTVAEVQQRLAPERELAYTTVMTVLDRLAKKGLAVRERAGRAWSYAAAEPQAVVLARELAALLADVGEEVRAEVLRMLPGLLNTADSKTQNGE